jgi:hypothetical protein
MKTDFVGCSILVAGLLSAISFCLLASYGAHKVYLWLDEPAQQEQPAARTAAPGFVYGESELDITEVDYDVHLTFDGEACVVRRAWFGFLRCEENEE